MVDNARQYTAYLGTVRTEDGLVVDVGSVPTGMGCPSVNVIVTDFKGQQLSHATAAIDEGLDGQILRGSHLAFDAHRLPDRGPM